MAIKLLTYNTAILSDISQKIAGIKEGYSAKLLRAQKIIDKIILNNYDIICLQEVFEESVKDLFEENLINAGYKVIVKATPYDFIKEDSGLFFASRFPFSNANRKSAFRRFDNVSFPDGMADKGLFGCVLDISDIADDRILYVFNTHLQSDRMEYGIRIKQIRQIRKSINYYLLNQSASFNKTSILLAGDMNVIGIPTQEGESNEEYKILIEGLGFPKDIFHDLYPDDRGYTWDYEFNSFIRKNDPNDIDKQRLDYVFAFDKIPNLPGSTKSIKLKKIECNYARVVKFTDNNALDLSDHFGLEIEIY